MPRHSADHLGAKTGVCRPAVSCMFIWLSVGRSNVLIEEAESRWKPSAKIVLPAVGYVSLNSSIHKLRSLDRASSVDTKNGPVKYVHEWGGLEDCLPRKNFIKGEGRVSFSQKERDVGSEKKWCPILIMSVQEVFVKFGDVPCVPSKLALVEERSECQPRNPAQIPGLCVWREEERCRVKEFPKSMLRLLSMVFLLPLGLKPRLRFASARLKRVSWVVCKERREGRICCRSCALCPEARQIPSCRGIMSFHARSARVP